MAGQVSRRAQSASSAAVLVAIIGGLLVLYILFLPPAEREQLLFGNGGSGGQYSGGQYGSGGVFTQYGAVLLATETPGTLRLLGAPVREHAMPSTTIFTAIHTQEIQSVESAIVQNSVFSKKDLELTFLADPLGSNNYLLSFNIDEAGYAPLRILVNGKQIYERPIRERTPAPIPVPSDYLVDGENTVTLQTLDTGLAFWRPNAYVLHNVLVSADVIDTRGATSEQRFSITEEEMASFQSASLQFVPDCDPRNAGRLAVQLNEIVVQDAQNRTSLLPNLLYNGFVDCGVLFKTDVPKSYLYEGENRIFFASQNGQYVIDRIKLVIQLEQSDYPVYYINLPREMYDSIDLGANQVRLTMTFSDYRNEKRGEVVINGFVESFDSREYVWQALVDPAILNPGPNTIQIIPHVDRLDISELKVELV